MTAPTRDIETRADCESVVREFYARAFADPIIGFLFTDVAHLDLEAHVPRITSFWETILLGAQTYSGGAFAPHAALHAKAPLRAGHFDRWVWLWTQTVEERFSGPRADLARHHAQRVATAFHARLSGQPEPAVDGGLLVIQPGAARPPAQAGPDGGPAGSPGGGPLRPAPGPGAHGAPVSRPSS